MKNALGVVLAIAVTILCWGVYGPVLHKGQHAMGDSRLWPFLYVGVAYFLIAVLVPLAWLAMRGEKGRWTAGGNFWSLAAGAAGAIGALGIILAFAFKGRPVFVMPLVFGGAPVVNSFVTMFLTKSTKRPGPLFLAGLIMVILGAVVVLTFKPGPQGDGAPLDWGSIPWVIAAVLVVVATWGSYGPVLHKGQMKMEGSRLRPLVCVGLAYFAIAVVVPALALSGLSETALAGIGEEGGSSWKGAIWSLAAGAAGAVGALGIIMAFNFGGKPIFVMPLVFGGAPVVNTFTTIASENLFGQIHPIFYSGLILVAVGAVIVLLFAPKGAPPKKEESPPEPKMAAPEPEAESDPDTTGAPAAESSTDATPSS